VELEVGEGGGVGHGGRVAWNRKIGNISFPASA
jgi:hypothetical protein